MKDQFGLILLVIIVVILVGGFALLSRGRRPRTPKGNETTAQHEARRHEDEREEGRQERD